MPSDFECHSCKLAFCVGWYHYHRHDTGYWARTLLVCAKCGTQHSIEHALAKDGAEKEPEALESYGAPLKNAKKLKLAGIERLSPDEAWTGRVPFEGKKAAELACQHCATAGTLVSEWQEELPCPSCSRRTIKCLGSWMT